MKFLEALRTAREAFWALQRRQDDHDRKLQLILSNQYRTMPPAQRPSLAQTEFSSYSQNGEDGTLLYIFSIIEEASKVAVELCAGDGIECNAANLILNHGWTGLLLDGDPTFIERGRKFYAQRTNAWRSARLPPKLVQAWITAENINGLIVENGFSGEIDLLSLDLDGVDYWIWKAITSVSPRVVVLEYNNRFGPDQSVTVPYAGDFRAENVYETGYFGASLAAFAKLGAAKGYRLIGANGPNTNAYFMRDDVGVADFPAVSVESCLSSAYAISQRSKWSPANVGPLVKV